MDDFTLMDSSSAVATNTNVTGMYPGQRLTFALKITNPSSLNLYIREMLCNDTVRENALLAAASKPNIQNKYLYNTSEGTVMNVGWAMDIYTLGSATSSAYCAQTFNSNTKSFLTATNTNNATTPSSSIIRDQFAFAGGSGATLSSYLTSKSISGSSENVTTKVWRIGGVSDNGLEVFSANSLGSPSEYYLFYSVLFSDSDSTYYTEVKSNSDSTYVEVPPTTGNRYFKAPTPEDLSNSRSTSNCYASLSFALTKLNLVIG